MRIPKRFTFFWWQLALYELALFSLGAGISGLWPQVFKPMAPYLLFIFVLLTPFIVFWYLNQIRSKDEDENGGSPSTDDTV